MSLAYVSRRRRSKWALDQTETQEPVLFSRRATLKGTGSHSESCEAKTFSYSSASSLSSIKLSFGNRNMESKRKSKDEKKSQDERKRKRHRTEEVEETESRKSDKKERGKDRKSSKHRSGKEKKSRDNKGKHKRKDKDLKHNIQELSSDDYFLKNNEFATWLKEERGVFFSDLSAESARELFSKFIKEWNRGKLESRYYEGIASGRRTAHEWKIKV